MVNVVSVVNQSQCVLEQLISHQKKSKFDVAFLIQNYRHGLRVNSVMSELRCKERGLEYSLDVNSKPYPCPCLPTCQWRKVRPIIVLSLYQVAELKVQLKMTEETRDAIRRDLIEANRKIREGA